MNKACWLTQLKLGNAMIIVLKKKKKKTMLCVKFNGYVP